MTAPDEFSELLTALKSEDVVARISAAEELGRRGDEQAIPFLIDALKDPDFKYRQYVAESLCKLVGPHTQYAVEPLIDALSDISYSVQASTMHALGQIGDGRAVGPLLALYQKTDHVNWQIAMDTIVTLGRPAVKPLIEHLKAKDRPVLPMVPWALEQLGDVRAVPALIEVLNDENSSVRHNSARALGRLGDLHAVVPLIQTLKDKERNVRTQAAQALARLGSAETLPLQVIACPDLTFDERLSTLIALRGVRYRGKGGLRLWYRLPPIRKYCQALLNQEDLDANIRAGAVGVLERTRRGCWLFG